MSKTHLTVFLCAGKDCRKAWRHICDGSPGKWLRRHVEDAGLPYKLDVIKTECMDRCKHAANLCLVHDGHACEQTEITCDEDANRLLAALRDVAGDGWKSSSPLLSDALEKR
jgi:predicted metal-binding protein